MSQLPLAAASPSLAAGRWTRPLFRRLAAFRSPLLQCKHSVMGAWTQLCWSSPSTDREPLGPAGAALEKGSS